MALYVETAEAHFRAGVLRNRKIQTRLFRVTVEADSPAAARAAMDQAIRRHLLAGYLLPTSVRIFRVPKPACAGAVVGIETI
jgi:hypothetical protein